MSFDLTTLGEFATIQGGFAYKSQDFITEPGIPVLKIKNIRHGFIDYASLSYVSEEVAHSTTRWFTEKGDILISMTGSGPSAPESLVGRVARVWENEPKALINQRVGRLILREKEEVHLDFLYFLLSQKETQSYLVANSTGSANQVNISSKTIEGVPCPRVGFNESKEISDFLNILELRARLLRETNKTLESIAQAIFKSWFVDFDPVRAKMEGRQPEGMDEATAALFPDSFEESELGLIPKGWLIGCLNNLSTLNPESWTAKKHPHVLIYVDLANTKENVISETSVFSFDDAPSRARRVLRTGDSIIGTVRPGNKSFAFIQTELDNLTGSTGFAVLRPLTPELAEFIYLSATQDSAIDYLAHVADGGAYPAVRPEVVSQIKSCHPPEKVLEHFHSVVSPLFKSVAHNQLRIAALSTLRDTLLPRLISGQLRLPEAESLVQEACP